MTLREQRAAAARAHSVTTGRGSSPLAPIVWTQAGPAPLASDATGEGQQDYNWVSGRATSVLIDPADASGNTVLLGGAYGGLWKSTNAGSQSSSPSSVIWQPLLDDQPTLAVGAIALQPVGNGNPSNVILVGTGETNSSGDSYYGLGILRSSDAGSTWAEITSAASGESFLGIGFSKIAFSTANPSVVVAATAGDNGLDLGLEEDANSTARGLYYSRDAGVTWNRVVLSDGAVAASATAVIYNASAGSGGTFYASIRRHGLYSSTDGQHFTRLTTQPGAGLASSVCPAMSNANTCLIYRGEFAVVPGRNEMYIWVIDVQPGIDGNPAAVDEGIWKTTTGGTSWTQIPDNGITNCGDSAFGANSGCGVEQGYYNLELAAIPNGSLTDIYAGAVNLYKCTLQGGTVCTQADWINLTHVYGCNPGPLGALAHVHPDQHAVSLMVANGKAVGYFAHDGGISRTLDGYSDLNTGSCSGTNQFDSLSETLGSMTEFVSISLDPTNPDIMLGGTQDNGSPKTNNATVSATWQNALGGDGGFNAINPNNLNEWFAANPFVTIVKCELGTNCNDAGFSEIVSSTNLGGDQGSFYTPYILDPQNTNELLVGTCRVWRISTSGTSPLQLSNDFDSLGTGACTGGEINLVNGLAAGGPPDSNNNSTVVYAVTNGYGPLSGMPGGEVWATTSAGNTLMANVTQNINPSGFAISSVEMDPSDTTGNTAYVGIMGFSTQMFPTSHVWKTVNAGSSWADWSGTGLPDAPLNSLLVDAQPGLIYAGTDVGVFVSSTSTASWIEAGPVPGPGVLGFLPNAPVTALRMFNPNAGTKTLVASTYGRGVWNYALVTTPDFRNAVSNSPQTIFATQTTTFNGTLAAKNGYTSPVNLSCAGAAPSTCTLRPAQITPTAAYAITAGGSVGDYNFNAHAVGTDNNATTHDAPITLHIVDFNLTAPNPNSITVGQGSTSGPSTFQVTASGSFAGIVTLSCASGLPAGAACLFSPSSSVSPTSTSPVTVTLMVNTGAATPVGGPTTITISATTNGAPTAKTQIFSLTVTGPAPDFTIAVIASPNTALINQTVTWNGTLSAVNGYNKSVQLSCTAGAPATCGIAPATLTPTTNGALYTVTLASPSAGSFNFSIQGRDGTVTHSTPSEVLTVGTDFTWTDTGGTSVTVSAGQTATYTFSANPDGATFGSAVSFGCSGVPSFTSCSFNPTAIAAGAGTTPVTVMVTTTGPSRTAPRMVGEAGSFRPYMFLSLGILGMVGIFGVGRNGRGNLRLRNAICLGLVFLILTSCGGLAGGGGGGGNVTPPGTSQVTVSATEAGVATHGDLVTLIVQ